MANRQAEGVLHGLRHLTGAQAAQLTDGQLLQRFAADRDEGAFAALLQRHGALVYGVCRNILRHDQDAEDAFQGTFLVLARRAAAIRHEKALGSWLYRVAYRVSMKARAASDRRKRREAAAVKSAEDQPVGDLAWRELQGMLDEELNRLPEKYRAPFVLCVLTGKSKAEAAAELGWKEGTVSSRLAKAREVLQRRLARRGVALSALLSGLAISQPSVSALVPAALLAATRKAALAFAAGGRAAAEVAAAPAALARSVLRSMTAARAKLPAAVLLVAGLAGGAAAVALLGPAPAPALPEAPAAPPAAQLPPEAPPGTKMTVAGTVVGPFGAPFPGADVAVVVSRESQPGEVYGPARYGTELLGRGRTDGKGQYELLVAQTTHGHRGLKVWAHAPGHAPHVRTVQPQAITNPRHEFRGQMGFQLIPGRTVRGRLLGPDGKPAGRVPVLVLGMVNEKGPLRITVVHYEPPTHLPGWPRDVVTDGDGVFTLRDIGPNTKVLLQVRDERYATTWLSVQAGTKDPAEPVDLHLLPPRTLVGRVAAEDTGKPLAHADVVVETRLPHPAPVYGAFPGYVTARTDEKGEFRVRPFPGERLEAFVYPARGEPYLAVRRFLTWPADKAEHRFDLPVPRGVPVRGKVEEDGTGAPVAGAAVTFRWGYRNNPHRVPARPDVEWRHRDTTTDADGKFAITVPPGPGLLMVKAAEPDFVRVETSSRAAEGGKGGTPYFPDAFSALALRPGEAPPELALRVRRGATVRGRVLSADGTPVKSALLFSPTYIPDGVEFKGRHLAVRDGRFELPGCAPDGKVSVWVYDPQKKEGGHAEFAVGGDEPTVRLSPCGSGIVRVIDRAGQPAGGTNLSFSLVLRPGEDANRSADSGTPARLDVPDTSMYSLDLQPADAGDGLFRLRDLIPGATYTVRALTSSLFSDPLTFTAPAAGEQALGTLTLRPPEPPKKAPDPPAPGRPYIYEPRALDPDGDPMTFDLVQGPPGMTFDPQTGVLFWVPTPQQVGRHPVVLRVSDSYGRTAVQRWQITVHGPPPGPLPAPKKP